MMRYIQILEREYELLKQSKNSAARESLTDGLYRALSMVHTFRPNWETFSLGKTLHRHEARYIQMALEDASGNISRATRLLGLRRHQTLHKILRRRHKNLRHILEGIQSPETELSLNSETNLNEIPAKAVHIVRILHVEDDTSLARLVNEIADIEGWELEHFTGGNAALKELSSDAEYDLLLTDYELPGLNGLELVRQARIMSNRRSMRIVIMSGTLDERDAREAGADAFLRKPQDIGKLVKAINTLVEERDPEL